MRIEELRNKKIIILGLGREGLAAAKFLRENQIGVKIGLADLRKKEDFRPEESLVLAEIEGAGGELHLGDNYLGQLKNYEVMIKSPGISLRRYPQIGEALKAGVTLTSSTNIFFAEVKGKVIAVTGSKGKSTTSSLIAAVLKNADFKVELVGNIGKPALDFLKDDAADKYYVFEISSYQLENFEGSPDIAVLVSFFPEHLDYHGDEKAYLEAKMQIVSRLKPDSKVIYNYASEKLRTAMVKKFGVDKNDQLCPFNDGDRSKLDERHCLIVDGQQVVCLQDIMLFGVHNLENILAVCEVAKALNIPMLKVASAVNTFKGLEHRLEEVGLYKMIVFYNDAISTTPESTIAALEAMKMVNTRKQAAGVGTLIVGGLDRGYKFGELAKQIVDDGVKTLLLFPDTGKKIGDEVKKYAEGKGNALPQMIEVKTMEEAVSRAFELTPPKTICLLSCASPSFNLFKNFEDRGKQFKDLIIKMGGVRG